MKKQYPGTPVGMRRSRLRMAAEDGPLPLVLRSIGDAIQAETDRIEAVQRNTEVDAAYQDQWDIYSEVLTDELCDYVEDMLGTAFVVCQRYITSVSAAAAELYEVAAGQGQHSDLFGLAQHVSVPEHMRLGAQKHSLRYFEEDENDATNIPPVEALHALANFFKHHDEWPQPWLNHDGDILHSGHAASTWRKCAQLGLAPHTSGQLRDGFEAVAGHANYERVDDLYPLLRDWAKRLVEYADGELG